MAIKGSGSPMEAVDEYFDMLIKSRFIELVRESGEVNTLREFIHPYKAKKAGNSTYPILSITKDYGIVLQDEKFKKRIASVDTSSYKIVPRGLIVQGIHIDERNFGVQDLVEEGIVSPAYKLWSVNVDRADPYVVAYAMRSDYLTDYIESKFRGSIRRREHITDNDLLDAPANIPSMKHQKIFLEFVKQAEKSKTICKQIFQSLDNLIKSRFIEMFGDPTNNEKQWPTKIMKDIAPSVQANNKPMSEGNWLLNLDAIQSNSGEILFKKRVSDLELNGSIMAFSSDHVLYSKLRPYLNKVAVPDESGYGTTELIPLLPDKSKLTRLYLAHLLRSDAFVSKFSSAVAGTKMPRVSMNVFWKFEVPIPPIDLQEDFGKFVEQIDKSKFVETVEPDHPAVFQNVHGFPSFGLIST